MLANSRTLLALLALSVVVIASACGTNNSAAQSAGPTQTPRPIPSLLRPELIWTTLDTDECQLFSTVLAQTFRDAGYPMLEQPGNVFADVQRSSVSQEISEQEVLRKDPTMVGVWVLAVNRFLESTPGTSENDALTCVASGPIGSWSSGN
jgi:hypothetical protein